MKVVFKASHNPRDSLILCSITSENSYMNNRLKLMRIYLVGPMDFDREAGKPWRIELTKWLKSRRALPIDPYHKPMLAIHEDAMESDDGYERRKKAMATLPMTQEARDTVRDVMKPVVHTDLRIVDHSDALVVNLDVDRRPCGTFDEMFTADNQNKPVIVYCPQGVQAIHDWCWGRLKPELFFDDWVNVKEYLRHIDEDDDIDLLGRWKFFDFEPLIREVLEMNIIAPFPINPDDMSKEQRDRYYHVVDSECGLSSRFASEARRFLQ